MIQFLQDLIKPIFELIGMPEKWHEDLQLWLSLAAVFSTITGAIVFYTYKLVKTIILWRIQSNLNKDLHPFYTKDEIDKSTHYYIPTKYQDLSPSQAEEPGRAYISSPKGLLVPTMLNIIFNDDSDRYYLILADSGMGKTTFMINLYLAYKKQRSWKKKYEIKLLPLAHPRTFEVIDKLQNQENTILLLDALDEDNEAVKNYQERLEQIIDRTWKFRKIIITCRTQFFPREQKEPSKVGYFRHGPDGGSHHFRKQYISIFDDDDIRSYLWKQFGALHWKKRKKAWHLVHNSPSLMVRPMLLSNIKDLVKENKTYQYSYQIYEALIQKWIDREARKPGIEAKYGSQVNFKRKLYAFSRDLAKNLYLERGNREGRLSIHYTEQITTSSGFQLSEYEDLMKEPDWRNRSLLNRDADGQYKFSHKSILEYFLAREAIENNDFFIQFHLEGMDAAQSFMEQIIWGEVFIKSEGTFTTKELNIPRPLSQITKEDFPDVTLLKITNANQINFWCLLFFFKSSRNSTLIFMDKLKLPLLYPLYKIMFYRWLYVRIREKWKLLELHHLPELRHVPELLKLLELRKRPELSEWLELRKQMEQLEQSEQLELSELLEQLERMEQRGQLELREQLEWMEQLEQREPLEFREQLEQLEQLEKLILLEPWELREQLEQLERLILLEPWEQLELRELLVHIKKQDLCPAVEFKAANTFINTCQELQKALPNIKIIY